MKLGIFGGTFNPVHFGHLRAAEEVREALGLERVLFIPSGTPPLKTRDLADARSRFQMVKAAVRGNPRFDLLDIECVNAGKSYTVDTLEELHALYKGSELHFIVGIDAFLDLPNWREPDRILSLAEFAIISRPGHRFEALAGSPYLEPDRSVLRKLDAGDSEGSAVALKRGGCAHLLRVSTLGISSSDIRMRLQRGATITYLVPEEVELFIIAQKLYNTKSEAS